jgi:hypothetical protein
MKIKCPACGSGLVSVRCELWVDFAPGDRREIDEENLETVEPKPGAEACCRSCATAWRL